MLAGDASYCVAHFGLISSMLLLETEADGWNCPAHLFLGGVWEGLDWESYSSPAPACLMLMRVLMHYECMQGSFTWLPWWWQTLCHSTSVWSLHHSCWEPLLCDMDPTKILVLQPPRHAFTMGVDALKLMGLLMCSPVSSMPRLGLLDVCFHLYLYMQINMAWLLQLLGSQIPLWSSYGWLSSSASHDI